jgi:hypothetical protein
MRLLVPAILVVVIASPLVSVASAQSLGDLSRKEEERRKAVKPAEKARLYTNKDLRSVQAPTPSTSAAAPAAAPAPSDPAKEAATAEANKAKEPVKDQAYWAGRMQELLSKRERDQIYADALQTRINSLATDIVNRDDPARRAVLMGDRQKAVEELARLKQDIADGRKAIADLEEEARRARVPPGWLR